MSVQACDNLLLTKLQLPSNGMVPLHILQFVGLPSLERA